MDWLRRIRFKVMARVRDRSLEADVAEELAGHLERLMAQNRAAGMSPADARRNALRQFGNVAVLQEDARDARRFAWVEILIRDLAYASRQLRRTPTYALTAVLSLAMGIGASVAIFSAVNAILLRDLPLPHAERLGVLRKGPRGGVPQRGVAPAESLEIVERLRAVAAASPFTMTQFELRQQRSAERVAGMRVGAAFFSTLEVAPTLGRDFLASDDRFGAERVAIIGSGLWRRMFARDPHVIGRHLDLGSDRLTIVGVMPDGFRFPNVLSAPSDPEVWTPLAFHPNEAAARGAGYMFVLLKRKVEGSWSIVQRELDGITRVYERTQPSAYGNQELRAMPAHEQVVGRTRPMLLLLWACVSCLLLISCANTANLLLSRSTARSRELAVRASIGASRRRLFSQLATESLLLAVIAAVAGVALAGTALWLARQSLSTRLPRAEEIGFDWSVLLFTLALTVLTSIIVGFAPAYQLSNVAPGDALNRAATRSSSEGRWASRARRALLVAQVAMALILATTAALLGRSLSAALGANLGFRPESLLTLDLSIGDRAMTPAGVTALYDRLADTLRARPEIAAVGALNLLPLSGADFGWGYAIADRPVPDGAALPSADVRIVTPGTLEALGVPIRAGRSFQPSDRAGGQLVAVVNEAFARQWGGEDPIGKQIKLAGPAQPWMTVVGVSGDVRLGAPDRPARPAIYRPQSQHSWRDMSIVVRATLPDVDVVAMVRTTLEGLGHDVAILKAQEFTFYLSRSVADRRFMASLVAVFAAMALAIALVGVYGVFAYAVTARTRDIGVRLALGAGRWRVVWMVMRESLAVVSVGALVGVLGIVAARRLIETQLFEITAVDAGTLSAVSSAVLGTALLACVVPARRAASVDPTMAMRVDN